MVWVLLAGCGAPPGPQGEASSPGTTGCSDASCREGVQVAFVSAGVFPAGQYAVVSVFEGGGRSCGFEVGGSIDVCGFDVPCLLADSCDADWNFFAVPHSVSVFVTSDTPATLDVELRRGADPVAGAAVVPQYRTVAPAGPECEPTCQVADVSLEVE